MRIFPEANAPAKAASGRNMAKFPNHTIVLDHDRSVNNHPGSQTRAGIDHSSSKNLRSGPDHNRFGNNR
jgi:hypothetical protein